VDKALGDLITMAVIKINITVTLIKEVKSLTKLKIQFNPFKINSSQR